MKFTVADRKPWIADAACIGMDTNAFTWADYHDEETAPYRRSWKLLVDFNTKRMSEAVKVCEGCPVRAACLSSASTNERHWTIRGGQLPSVADPRARKSGSVPSADTYDYVDRKRVDQ